MIYRSLLAVCLIFLAAMDSFAQGKVVDLSSPNDLLLVRVETGEQLAWSLSYAGKVMLLPSPISLTLGDGKVLGPSSALKKVQRRQVDQILVPVVRTRFDRVRDHFNEMILDFSGDFSVVFRAYDDGIAYRFVTRKKGVIRIVDELSTFAFGGDHALYFAEEPSFYSHQEQAYKLLHLGELNDHRRAYTPALVSLPQGFKALISEADLQDYPGMWLSGDKSSLYQLKGRFPQVVLRDSVTSDRDVKPIERADYIAETKGARAFPWRFLLITERDGHLLENTMVFKLSQSTQISSTDWIKPGKVAWDWWNANNVWNVPFKAGLNTATYKYYIDFASRYGIEYIILDEGWYKLGDLLSPNPDIDVPELIRYGREKKVSVILWVTWKTLLDQLQPALDRFAVWGVQGIKVDFMQRDDQYMVNYYWMIAREAAARKLLVDFHGAYKPAGLDRAYPNVLTREGVKGLEHNKWSRELTPTHNLILPFTRMAVGPMDYTPGAMVNAQARQFQVIFDLPMSQTTRCQQMAMYVVYESPLQMLADSPSRYLAEPGCTAFMAGVPVQWDETRVLQASAGEYVVVARRSGAEWYIGAMNNEKARDLTVSLDFLASGGYEMHYFADGINAGRCAMDYSTGTEEVTARSTLTLQLAEGGGWVARVKPLQP